MHNHLSPAEMHRYSRHLLIPGVGKEGQLRLKNASVLLVGTGALGSPVALYLAAAGVGRLGLVDADVVDASNLQRQILHGESWIGKSKVESAQARLKEVNPLCLVELFDERLTPDNAIAIAQRFDLIVDGSDNFQTRYLTNDTAYFLKKPLVYAAIHRFEGQMAVFAPHLKGPCYRCLVPAMPPAGAVPSCQEAGVFGVLPGVMGSLQAAEAIKILLGIGTIPLERLTCYDALSSEFRALRLRRDPECRLCGDKPTINSVINEETMGSSHCETTPIYNMQSINTLELRERLSGDFKGILIDVREVEEYEVVHIKEARLIPLQELPSALDSLPKDQEILIHCKMGGRSARAVQFMMQNGFTNVKNVTGGMDAWLAEEE